MVHIYVNMAVQTNYELTISIGAKGKAAPLRHRITGLNSTSLGLQIFFTGLTFWC